MDIWPATWEAEDITPVASGFDPANRVDVALCSLVLLPHAAENRGTPEDRAVKVTGNAVSCTPGTPLERANVLVEHEVDFPVLTDASGEPWFKVVATVISLVTVTVLVTSWVITLVEVQNACAEASVPLAYAPVGYTPVANPEKGSVRVGKPVDTGCLETAVPVCVGRVGDVFANVENSTTEEDNSSVSDGAS